MKSIPKFQSLSTIIYCVILVDISTVHSQILDESACVTLSPNTAREPLAPVDNLFAIQVSTDTYTTGQTIEVLFTSSPPAFRFQEIIVQARPIFGAIEPVGFFSLVNGSDIAVDPDFRIYNCNDGIQGSTVGTDSTSFKTMPVTFTYTAPNQIVGNIQFRSTIVLQDTFYFENINSAVIRAETTVVNNPPQFLDCSTSLQEFPVFQNQVVYVYDIPMCSDPDGDETTVTCQPPPFTVVEVIPEITCSCTDNNGGSATSCTIPVAVVNNPPQFVDCSASVQEFSVGQNQAVYVYAIPMCSDPDGDDTTVTCQPPPSTVMQVTSEITCSCTDNNGGSATSCTIPVAAENTAPMAPICPDVTLTAVGENTAVDSFSGIFCNDAEDGPIFAECTPPAGSFFSIGTSSVSCTCTDSGGETNGCMFVVFVEVVNIPPQFVDCSTSIQTFPVGQTEAVYLYDTPMCSDPDGDETTVTCLPPPLTVVPVATRIICSCADNNDGNALLCTIPVVENTAPMEPLCPDVTVTSVTTNTAVDSLSDIFCNDAEDGPIFAECTPSAGSLFPIGTSSVSCTCIDSGGETNGCTFEVIVEAIDTVPPVITFCPNDITQTVLIGEQGGIVEFQQPSATDNSGTVSLSNNPEFYSGFYIPVGTSAVTYEFTDNVGLTAICTFTVTVLTASPCESAPCLNGGVCLAVDLDRFWCVCPNCLLGDRCEISVDACNNNQCMNGGSCRVYPGSCTQTFCDCPPCFTGANCQITVNPCDNNQCQNGGLCVPDGQSCTSYSCLCSGCSTGLFCAEAFDPCSRTPCQNGGICNNIDESCVSYSCECVGCFTGYDCQLPIPDPCLRAPCVNGGICQRIAGLCVGYTCQCPLGFSGPTCENFDVVFTDPCSSFPCMNDGCCIPLEGVSYKCICRRGYTGILCADVTANVVAGSDSCTSNPCNNGGTCFNSYNSNSGTDMFTPQYTCVCPQGFAGLNCLLPTESVPGFDFCNSMAVTCQNGGTCRNTYCSFSRDSGTFCECPIGFFGERCQIADVNPCESNPCRNDGICTSFNKYFVCQCQPSFSGPTCESEGPDVTNPVISNCPSQGIQVLTTGNDNFATVNWPPLQVSDNSGHVELITSNGVPGNYPVGQRNIVITYGDAAGNTATCSFLVTVMAMDGTNTPPSTPSCPSSPFTVTAPPGVTETAVDYGDVNCFDNQGVIPAFCTEETGTSFSLGTTPVSCICTDNGGLTSNCVFNVVVEVAGTNTPPSTPSCPSSPFTVNVDPGVTETVVDYGDVTCSDNQGIIPALCTEATGTNFNRGITPVSCTCEDNGGVTSNCVFDVVVQEALFYSRGDLLLITSPNFPGANPPGPPQTTVVTSDVNLNVTLTYFQVPPAGMLSIGSGNDIGSNVLSIYQTNTLDCVPNVDCMSLFPGNTFWVQFEPTSVGLGQGYVLTVEQVR